jgi:hypothetical protein
VGMPGARRRPLVRTMTNTRRALGWINGFLVVCATTASAQTAPSAPTLLSPSSGSSVQIPFAISWSSVSDPAGIVAYNWQVSPSSSFSPIVLQDSTHGQTQATVSGLGTGTGTYFWRVQAVNGSFVQGAWSAARSFTVTGAGTAAPGTPMLGDPKGYSTFHPREVMTFSWTAVPGAATYVLQAATDSGFPVTTRIQFDNIPASETTYSFAIANPEGNYWARVFAVDANGIFSQPSNLTAFSVFYGNPLPPSPSPLAPANGTLTLPITGDDARRFNIFTSSVSVDTPVTISVSGGGVTKSAALLVTPSSSPPTTGTATLTLTASGRSGETVSSTPSGLKVAVGSTGSASFATRTSITLSVSNGRDAIWSGACSSNGNKTKTCTFTLNANGSVSANVQ